MAIEGTPVDITPLETQSVDVGDVGGGGDVPPDWGGDVRFIVGSPVVPTSLSGFAFNVDLANATKDRAIISDYNFVPPADIGVFHIYTYDGLAWELEQTIGPPAGGSWFGDIVAMNGDGTRVAVAQQVAVDPSNSIFIYDRTGTTWSLVDTVTVDYGSRSTDLVLSSDGDTLISSNNSSNGLVNIFKWNGSSFDLEDSLDIGTNTNFGNGLNISEDGRWAVLPEPNNVGAINVYFDDLRDGTWVRRGGTNYGGMGDGALDPKAAAISGDGSIVTCVRNNSTLYTWVWDGGAYILSSSATSNTGSSSGLSSNGLVLSASTGSDGHIAMYQGVAPDDFVTPVLLFEQPDTDYAISASAMSYDGSLVLAGQRNWNNSNSNPGRFFSITTSPEP